MLANTLSDTRVHIHIIAYAKTEHETTAERK